MEFLHNSEIKKNASEIFELNQFDKPIDKVMPFIQPVTEVKIKGYANFVKTASFTTSSTRDTYITNIAINTWEDSTPIQGQVIITFTTYDNQAITYALNTAIVSGTSCIAQTINCENYPIKLARNSTFTISGTDAQALIIGFEGSDRS